MKAAPPPSDPSKAAKTQKGRVAVYGAGGSRLPTYTPPFHRHRALNGTITVTTPSVVFFATQSLFLRSNAHENRPPAPAGVFAAGSPSSFGTATPPTSPTTSRSCGACRVTRSGSTTTLRRKPRGVGQTCGPLSHPYRIPTTMDLSHLYQRSMVLLRNLHDKTR